MRAIRYNILLILIGLVLYNCKGLYQNDFLYDQELVRLDTNTTIGYKLFQTGIDNYRFEFYLSENNDTAGLFKTYLNDAVFKKTDFQTIVNGDSIIIYCPLNHESREISVKQKVLFLKPVKIPQKMIHKDKQQILINGESFSNLDEFYSEIENKLTKNLDWEIGRNLDALNDILRGGFGVYEYGESVSISWTNSQKSKTDLGFDETIKYIENKLETCHPSNRVDIEVDLELARQQKGKTLFELIVEIIEEHDNIILTLD